MKPLGPASALVLALAAAAAPAQESPDFLEAFSGEWYVFEASARSGGDPCRIDLEQAGAPPYPARSAGCTAPLGDIAAWRIEDGMISLSAGEGDRVATLGGSQFRLTGEFSSGSDGLIMERPQGDGTSAQLAAAVRRHGCYYAGFGSDCASPEALAAPPKGPGRIEALANVNVRTQPRRGAEIIGVVPQGATISTQTCLQASDGYWCRAAFGEETGWIAKSALRQEQWPVITFSVVPGADS